MSPQKPCSVDSRSPNLAVKPQISVPGFVLFTTIHSTPSFSVPWIRFGSTCSCFLRRHRLERHIGPLHLCFMIVTDCIALSARTLLRHYCNLLDGYSKVAYILSQISPTVSWNWRELYDRQFLNRVEDTHDRMHVPSSSLLHIGPWRTIRQKRNGWDNTWWQSIEIRRELYHRQF